VAENSNLHFSGQQIGASHILFLNQTQVTKPFKMVLSYAWATKTQSLLNLTNTHGMTILQKEPINIPVFSTKRIFKLSSTLGIQRTTTVSQQKLTRGSLYFQFLEQRVRTNGNVDNRTFRLNGLGKLLQNTYLLFTKKWGFAGDISTSLLI